MCLTPLRTIALLVCTASGAIAGSGSPATEFLADFEDGTGGNGYGGQTVVFSQNFNVALDYPTLGNPGRAMRIHDGGAPVDPGGYFGASIDLDPAIPPEFAGVGWDLFSSGVMLSFDVRLENVGDYPDWGIRLEDDNDDHSGAEYTQTTLALSDYVVLNTTYQTVTIPLSDFLSGVNQPSLDCVTKIVIPQIGAISPPESIGLLIDNVTLTGGELSASGETFMLPTITGRTMELNGEPFELRAVAYSPTPIGTNPSTGGTGATTDLSLLMRDGPILREAGVNALRIYGGMVMDGAGNASFGTTNAWVQEASRQGFYVLFGTYIPANADFSDPGYRADVRSEHQNMVAQFGNESNILMWVVGNEVNLATSHLADYLSLMESVAQDIHVAQSGGSGPGHGPYVTVVNGDGGAGGTHGPSIAPSVDLWGLNIYRGSNFGGTFDDVMADMTTPFWLAEFGIDSWHYDESAGSPPGAEDQETQADFAQTLFHLIRRHSDVCIGGDIGFYPDEWWKSQLGGLPSTDSVHDYGGNYFGAGPDNHITEEWLGMASIADNGSSPDLITPKEALERVKAIFVGGLNAPAPFRADFNLSTSNNYGGLTFGIYGGTEYMDDGAVLLSNAVTGASGLAGDHALRSSGSLPRQSTFTYTGVVHPLSLVGTYPHDHGSGFDTLSFDARLGTGTAHADWLVRLEDDDGATEFNNTAHQLPALTTVWQHFEIPLSVFTSGAQPVDLSLLTQVVFAARNMPSGAGADIEIDLIVDNIVITGAQDISLTATSIDFETVDIIHGPLTATEPLQIFNLGSRPLHIDAMDLGGAYPELYSLLPATMLPVTLEPFASLDLEVVYSPNAVGSYPAMLTISSDSPGESSLVVPLSADAVPVGLSFFGGE